MKIIDRANQLIAHGVEVPAASHNLSFFLKEEQPGENLLHHLEKFTQLDDTDVMCTIKNWCGHSDTVLSRLSKGLVDRKLLKVKFSTEPFDDKLVAHLKTYVRQQLKIIEAEVENFVFTGEVVNTTYNPHDEHIKILYKDGTVSDISKVDNALIHQQVSATVKKYYLCHFK